MIRYRHDTETSGASVRSAPAVLMAQELDAGKQALIKPRSEVDVDIQDSLAFE